MTMDQNQIPEVDGATIVTPETQNEVVTGQDVASEEETTDAEDAGSSAE